MAASQAVVDVDNLAARMRRISELTDALMALQAKNDQARTLAVYVGDEIAVARLQIRLFTGRSEVRRVLRFAC